MVSTSSLPPGRNGWPGVADLRGAQRPRICSVPPYVSSAGAEAVDLAKMAGLELDPWQQFVLTHALGEREDGRWAAFEVGLVCPTPVREKAESWRPGRSQVCSCSVKRPSSTRLTSSAPAVTTCAACSPASRTTPTSTAESSGSAKATVTKASNSRRASASCSAPGRKPTGEAIAPTLLSWMRRWSYPSRRTTHICLPSRPGRTSRFGTRGQPSTGQPTSTA